MARPQLTFYRGETWTSPPLTVPGTGSLAGQTLTAFLVRADGDPAVVTLTVGNGITVADPANRVVTVTLAKAVTSILSGDYLLPLWRTDAGFETHLITAALTALRSSTVPG